MEKKTKTPIKVEEIEDEGPDLKHPAIGGTEPPARPTEAAPEPSYHPQKPMGRATINDIIGWLNTHADTYALIGYVPQGDRTALVSRHNGDLFTVGQMLKTHHDMIEARIMGQIAGAMAAAAPAIAVPDKRLVVPE